MDILGLGVSFSIAAGIVWWQYKQRSRYAGVAERADQEFRQLRIEEENPALCFDGRAAQTVHELRECVDRLGQVPIRITRYARNAHGEYFFFVSEGKGRPLFKHIGQASAQAALGDRYVAPPRAAG